MGWPLTRLFLSLGLGLMAALFTQSLKLDEKDRRRPAVCPPATPGRGPLCHLLLFGMAANTLLTKGYNNKTMDRKERILAKLFTR